MVGSVRFFTTSEAALKLKKRIDALAARCPEGARPFLHPFGVAAAFILSRLSGRGRLTPEWVHICPKPPHAGPLISVLTPVYNPKPKFLLAAIDSLLSQCAKNWELLLVHDGEPNKETRSILEEASRSDSRIRFEVMKEHGGISAATNRALSLARGKFVALLDHDDLLHPNAICEVTAFLVKHPDADMIYTDEDKTDPRGRKFFDPCFKPQWSPDSFLSRMYVGHLGVYRTSLAKEIGGFRSEFDGSQDYDFVLRFTEKTDRIHRIPRVLYHWRIHAESAAGSTGAKPYAYAAARRAIGEALLRRGERGRVTGVNNHPGHYRVDYDLKAQTKISICICTRDNAALLESCLASLLLKGGREEVEVILVDNGSRDGGALATIERWKEREARLHVFRVDEPFNFSRLMNFAASKASGELLLFLNDDTELLEPGSLASMAGQAMRRGVGAVGAKLVYPDGRVQHGGVILGVGGIAGHAHKGLPASSPGYWGYLACTNNFSAVTGACLMCRKSIFEEIGGFDEELAVAYNDVDLCLRMRKRGLYNVWLPHAVFVHHESKSRGLDLEGEAKRRFDRESEIMLKRWGAIIADDPHYSPNLTRLAEDLSPRRPWEE